VSEFERAWAFVDDLYRRAAQRVVPFRYGWAVAHDDLPRVHDLNFIRIEEPAPVDDLIAEAERLQADRGHRQIWLPQGEELEPPFRERGWQVGRFVLMAHHREPERAATLPVDEIGAETQRPVWAEGIAGEPFARDDPDLVRQLVEHKGVIADAVPTRYYAARVDGELAGYCELYERDGIAQPEALLTLERFRGRGVATSILLRTLEDARASGAELVFLVADAGDWPRRLYRRLGFDEIGTYSKFLRLRRTKPAGA
jgi:ribosomal protein S18 acetylase RimI-like enzyme